MAGAAAHRTGEAILAVQDAAHRLASGILSDLAERIRQDPTLADLVCGSDEDRLTVLAQIASRLAEIFDASDDDTSSTPPTTARAPVASGGRTRA